MMAAVVVPRGESLKYSVDVIRQKTICSARPAIASTAISRSSVAMPYAMVHRAHERADEHGTDNGDIRVDIEADTRDQHGNDQDA